MTRIPFRFLFYFLFPSNFFFCFFSLFSPLPPPHPRVSIRPSSPPHGRIPIHPPPALPSCMPLLHCRVRGRGRCRCTRRRWREAQGGRLPNGGRHEEGGRVCHRGGGAPPWSVAARCRCRIAVVISSIAVGASSLVPSPVACPTARSSAAASPARIPAVGSRGQQREFPERSCRGASFSSSLAAESLQ